MSEFRTASTASESVTGDAPSRSDISATSSDSTPGLFTYKALKGEPMTVSEFNLKSFWDSPSSDMKDSIESVDEWVQEQARNKGLEDTPGSYKEVVDEILNQIGRSENEKPHKTFERVQKAIDALNRLESAKLPKILNVNSLTADEYKHTRA